ncbi:hypothetical protein SEA_SUPPI_44 [Arthrobacter phage Suppi]|uniref:Uncharacterized protein n=5 Tax=Korravirus TaxID=1982076 RepID=A0A1D8ESQ4_9CAUD|nr:hypothetical protein FDH63_gp44 [Arthrobacter phage Wayne]YP_010050213.1 hypothetical protein KDJ02_gp44 [Arthrobacter phage Litotes]AOT24072.1 hypothetical protein SEA_SUPPI_44 [Arthrobacter phage Suppi]ASR83279.1 hypothetical protein SEA_CANOWICAKTE_44 [Arthrobacter phage Canowicakte]AZF97680.1 hypothetical protein SEA_CALLIEOMALLEY_44 [Arthrobacter phage CallieOMalley]QHB47213.1 hypothetical protein SEA_APPLECIDER_44 [Arthrobacter phage AppleCider]ALY10768.1 hypothetical protein PBI_WAY
MPKLPKNVAKSVEAAEAVSGDFALLDPGFYYAQLAEVEVQEGNYAPQWNATLENLHKKETLEKASGKQWHRMNVVTEEKAPANYTNGDKKWAAFHSMSQGQLKAFFEAFGYTPDSDTDEMIGEWVVIKVGIETIQGGARKGEKTNRVKALSPVPDDFDATELVPEDSDTF